jgi:hypothetical protein
VSQGEIFAGISRDFCEVLKPLLCHDQLVAAVIFLRSISRGPHCFGGMVTVARKVEYDDSLCRPWSTMSVSVDASG